MGWQRANSGDVDKTDMTTMSMRRRVAVVFCVAFLAVQVTVPIVQFMEPRPVRFGWQMYSGAQAPPEFWLVAEDGTLQSVEAREHFGNVRLEMDYLPHLPRHLCATMPDARAVRYQLPGASDTDEYECGR